MDVVMVGARVIRVPPQHTFQYLYDLQVPSAGSRLRSIVATGGDSSALLRIASPRPNHPDIAP